MSTDTETITLESTNLLEAKNFKEAIRLYSDWILRNVINGTTHQRHDRGDAANNRVIAKMYNNRGHVKYLTVDFEGALEDYNESLKYDSTSGHTYYNRGTIEYRMGNYERALENMTVACSLSPDCEEYKLARGRCETILTDPISRSEDDESAFGIGS